MTEGKSSLRTVYQKTESAVPPEMHHAKIISAVITFVFVYLKKKPKPALRRKHNFVSLWFLYNATG